MQSVFFKVLCQSVNTWGGAIDFVERHVQEIHISHYYSNRGGTEDPKIL